MKLSENDGKRWKHMRLIGFEDEIEKKTNSAELQHCHCRLGLSDEAS